jgi:SAM-dependent methyltransferase
LIKYVFGKTARYPGFEVEHYQFVRSLSSISLNLKYRGMIRTVLGLIAQFSKKCRLPILQNFLFYRQKMNTDWLDTDGVVEQVNLDIPIQYRKSATRYEATSEYEFRYVLERLKLPYEQYHFIDYGSGKGRVLAIAADYPFQSVTGIELSAQLHSVAEKNISDLLAKDIPVCGNVISRQCDAAQYGLPDGPHIIYLFNPFGADILEAVLDKISEGLVHGDHPTYLLYNNPMHEDVLRRQSLFRKYLSPMGGKWQIYVAE